MVETGLDVLLRERLQSLSGRRLGLITNQSAVTRKRQTAADALLAAGVNIKALFAPEHGINSEAMEGEHVQASVDPHTGLPVYSLYGLAKKPSPEMLADLDAIIFDIQDAGARFYTYLYTMAYSMQACAECRKPFILLDRPNPLGGMLVEGPVLKKEFASFVGLYPIPIRYGMTIGELARLFNEEFGIGVELEVVGLGGWRREMWFHDTGLSWIGPSPALQSLNAVLFYPGTCLLEGTSLSEGRGSSAPFEIVGAPWIDSYLLALQLKKSQLPGVRFHAAKFTPVRSKYAGKLCSGVRLEVTDRRALRPVLTGVKIMEVTRRLWLEEFEFLPPGADGRHFFDLLAGTERIRTAIETGVSAEDIADGWLSDIADFSEIRSRWLIYG